MPAEKAGAPEGNTLDRVDWLYFIAANADGTPRLVVRRNGPVIQLLTRDEGWIDRPQLLTRFYDPGFFETATFEEARAAAEAKGGAWPP